MQHQVSFFSEGEQISATLWLPEMSIRHPLVIVCHGAGGWKEDFDEICTFFARSGFAVMALDMRGHGQSEGTRWCLDMTQWAQDISSAIDYAERRSEIDAKRVGVWGFSSGGTAMYEAAVRDPRIKVLVGLDATISSSGMPLLATAVLGFLHGVGLVHKGLTGRDLRLDISRSIQAGQVVTNPTLNQAYLKNPRTLAPYREYPFPGGSQGWFISTYKRLSQVAVPTLILWGEKDDLDPVTSAEETYRRLRCSKQLEIIPENGHMGYVDINKSRVFEASISWFNTHLL